MEPIVGLIDGEIVVQDKNGIFRFRGSALGHPQGTARIVFFAFDLLHLDGRDLR